MPWPLVGVVGVMVVIALLWLPRRLRSLRAQRARCSNCGYLRTGIDGAAPCPECGRVVVSAVRLRTLRLYAGAGSCLLLAGWLVLPGKLGARALWRFFDPWQHVRSITVCGWTIDEYSNTLYDREEGWLTSADAMPEIEPAWNRSGHPILLRARSNSGAEWTSQAEEWRLDTSGTGRRAALVVMSHFSPGIFIKYHSFALFDCSDMSAPTQSGDEGSTWGADTDTMSFDSRGVHAMMYEEVGDFTLPLVARPVQAHVRGEDLADGEAEFVIDWEGTRAYYQAKRTAFAQERGVDPLDDDAVIEALLAWTRRPRSPEGEESGTDVWSDMEDLRAVVAEEALRGRADLAARLCREEHRTRSPESRFGNGAYEWPPSDLAEFQYVNELRALQIAPSSK